MTKIKLLLTLMALALPTMPAMASENGFFIMLSSATTTSTSGTIQPQAGKVSFQATARTTAGAGALTAIISASNDGLQFITLGTITLVLSTTENSDGFTSDNAWKVYKSSISAISGTGARATITAASKN